MEKPNLSGYSLKSFLSSVLLPVPDGPTAEETATRSLFQSAKIHTSGEGALAVEAVQSRTADDDRSDQGSDAHVI